MTTFPKPVVNQDGQNDKLLQSVRAVPGSQFILENLAESVQKNRVKCLYIPTALSGEHPK
jgi:hypothetical protein